MFACVLRNDDPLQRSTSVLLVFGGIRRLQTLRTRFDKTLDNKLRKISPTKATGRKEGCIPSVQAGFRRFTGVEGSGNTGGKKYSETRGSSLEATFGMPGIPLIEKGVRITNGSEIFTPLCSGGSEIFSRNQFEGCDPEDLGV
ncbi:hypothetical protein LZ554_002555 [Drepanopeziza brunnea f. sp. 'monogermtubi']|nr:hypothetical protein LZ554_002555 [Drepanopeziza brunnea f. sp. 'monogermtubi']